MQQAPLLQVNARSRPCGMSRDWTTVLLELIPAEPRSTTARHAVLSECSIPRLAALQPRRSSVSTHASGALRNGCQRRVSTAPTAMAQQTWMTVVQP